ncbi:MAG: hypothetical protein ACTSRP_22995, partial [Candidatus Helarchaeota archaeon]
MKYKKLSTILPILFILIISSSLITIKFNTTNNNNLPVEEKNSINISMNKIYGKGEACSITQYAQREMNISNFDVFNTKLSIVGDANSGVGMNSKEFNITVPQYYNATKIRLELKNITSRPTWIDIEQNASQSSTINFGTYYNILAGAMSFNITERTRVVKVAIYSDVGLNEDQNFTVGIYNRENQWTGKPNKKLEEHTYTGGYSWQWREFTFNLNLTPGSYFVVVNATYISGETRRFIWSTIADSSDSDGKEGDMWYYFHGNWDESTNNDLSLKIRTELIDSSNNTVKNINATKLAMNITANGVKKTLPDNGSIVFDNLNKNENITVLLEANSSFITNITWTAWYLNYTSSSISQYSYVYGEVNVTWNITFGVQFPENTYNYSF